MNSISKNKIEMMNELAKQGCSANEIAIKCNVSRQTIYNYISAGKIDRSNIRKYSDRDVRKDILDTVIYKNLREWMRNNNISIYKFHIMSNTNYLSLSNALRSNRNIRKSTIDAILKATGMTYEHAFEIDE